MGKGHGVQGKNHRPLEIVLSNSPGILEPGVAQSWEPEGSAQEGAVLSQGGGWMGCREVQINIVIFMGIKYVEQKHELFYPISLRGFLV